MTSYLIGFDQGCHLILTSPRLYDGPIHGPDTEKPTTPTTARTARRQLIDFNNDPSPSKDRLQQFLRGNLNALTDAVQKGAELAQLQSAGAEREKRQRHARRHVMTISNDGTNDRRLRGVLYSSQIAAILSDREKKQEHDRIRAIFKPIARCLAPRLVRERMKLNGPAKI